MSYSKYFKGAAWVKREKTEWSPKAKLIFRLHLAFWRYRRLSWAFTGNGYCLNNNLPQCWYAVLGEHGGEQARIPGFLPLRQDLQG